MTRYRVALASDIPEGKRAILNVAGRTIGVFNVAGSFFALRNTCPHQGGPLCLGDVYASIESSGPGAFVYDDSQHFLQCPWHGWEFDLRTGESWFDPKRTRVRAYEVSVERGMGTLAEAGKRTKGPYTAESYPTAVEQEFVVIDVGD